MAFDRTKQALGNKFTTAGRQGVRYGKTQQDVETFAIALEQILAREGIDDTEYRKHVDALKSASNYEETRKALSQLKQLIRLHKKEEKKVEVLERMFKAAMKKELKAYKKGLVFRRSGLKV